MSGTLALAKAEISRLRRNKRYLIFTVALPVMFYLIFGKSQTTGYGVSFAAFYMVGMATFGAFSGAFNNNTIRISQERKDGWIRQLRITSLPAGGYVAAKIVASLATSVPSIVIVLALGRFYGGVQLAPWKWIAIGLVIWLGSLAFAALAIAIGYRFMPDAAQPIAMFVYLGMSLLGGLWFPLTGALGKFAQVLPTYQVTRIGTDIIGQGTFPLGKMAIILAWLAGFVALAALSVRSTAEKI